MLLLTCCYHPFMPGWRNWQTQRTQNPPRFTPRGGSTPPPGTSNFGFNRLRSLPSTPLVFRDTFQGRKGFAHEQTRVRMEVCPSWQEVALLQTLHWKERENKA